MDLSTAERLTALNQRFYAEHAENFAEARPRLAAGVQRVLAGIVPGARVLEIGCGDGKVGRALARAGVGAYTGLDASEAMLERARRYTTARPASPAPQPQGGLAFLLADLADPAWATALPAWSFDWALAFAVFHHLPGHTLRADVLRAVAERLAPGGRVALSNWVFTRSERLRQRIVPWAEAGLSQAEVEPGDYLLSWERKGRRGLRYVHVLDQAEMARLAAGAGLRIVEAFSADGVTGELSDYAIMESE